MRTLLYEAANVMLTRYKGASKLKDWALARRLAIIMHAMLKYGTEFKPA